MQLTLRAIGFLASLLLTLAAYFVILNPVWFHLENKIAIVVIFILAILQALVQLVCFINLWQEKWNLSIFLHTTTVIFIIIVFSIWIMNRLNENMMF